MPGTPGRCPGQNALSVCFFFCKVNSRKFPGHQPADLAKDLAPYRIGKRSHKQNRAKIHQKCRKSYFLIIFDVFLPYFEGCCVFLPCRWPSLSQGRPLFVPPGVPGTPGRCPRDSLKFMPFAFLISGPSHGSHLDGQRPPPLALKCLPNHIT